ncbi:succinate dehydrogenase, hydrophobic membrane anchor protein [Fertoebacter nigrum]|uniref:Succinate dehydrogenase hydrophobic membrane anchor subunit n=1 Tax=Fertoeibacter niger TaxID=2656921 RepID=A0A8X8H2I7_9RHOB|nr:succinate dehydrogenase, hydrophobic membrane anchor protein [Fertoeibacter niger]NUB44378.1 succinate dehydrogenase, hydrophobic membrane anchor protein [Fertoeibacter niger]
MRYLTDRKRAAGLGSSKSGTEHFWHMQISSVALLFLVPAFIFTFGSALGRRYEDVLDYYSHPFPAVVAALTLIVGLIHFKNGAQVMIEDYAHGITRKALIIAATCFSYCSIAIGLFALVKLAL